MRAVKAKRITERDQEILHFIGEHEAASTGQLARKFWAGRQERTASDRLEELTRAGYLVKSTFQRDIQHQEQIYQLGRKSREILGPENKAYYGQIAEREKPEILRGVEAHLRLEEQGYTVKEWVSGRDLQREQSGALKRARDAKRTVSVANIADGAAVIEDPETGQEETVNIEIDGQYYGKMLRDKVQGFNGQGKTIWFTSSDRAGYVGAAIEEHGDDQEVIEI